MQGSWGSWWLLRRSRWLLRGPVFPVDALRTLYSHAEATRGAATSGRVSAVCQVRQAGGARVLCAVARQLGLLAGIAGVAGVARVEHLLGTGQALLWLLWKS